MARFDLNTYATVEERLRAFWSDPDNADARIVTNNHTYDGTTWIIEARLYLSAGDQSLDLAKTTGWASEVNKDEFALERCETSAIGRMLANYLYSGSKKGVAAPRPSREEMEKVQRLQVDYLEEAKSITDVLELRKLYTKAHANGAPAEVLERLKDIAKKLDSGSQDSGAGRSGTTGAETKTGKRS
jgi:hypothetical protein